jgi:hypothetical protein
METLDTATLMSCEYEGANGPDRIAAICTTSAGTDSRQTSIVSRYIVSIFGSNITSVGGEE